MGKFVKGDVIVVPFPFSDLTASKKRPALVVAALTGDDVILCQITSKTIGDSYAIPFRKRTVQPVLFIRTATSARTAFSQPIPISSCIVQAR